MDLDLARNALPLLFKGLSATLEITGCGIAIGFPLGLAFALARLSSRRALAGPASIYSMIFRGTPLLVQIFILYYGLGQIKFLRDHAALWWLFGDSLRC